MYKRQDPYSCILSIQHTAPQGMKKDKLLSLIPKCQSFITRKEVFQDAENLSAQEAPQKEGAWFQKENVHQQWPQGAGSSPCQGQSPFELLSLIRIRLTRAGRRLPAAPKRKTGAQSKRATVEWPFFVDIIDILYFSAAFTDYFQKRQGMAFKIAQRYEGTYGFVSSNKG